MKTKKQFGIRIDSDVLRKFNYVAYAEGRSASGQIARLINRCVCAFEKAHGPILFPSEDKLTAEEAVDLENRKKQAMQTLLQELEKGMKSGEEKGWLSSEEVRAELEDRYRG